jgi:hypothetical protein
MPPAQRLLLPEEPHEHQQLPSPYQHKPSPSRRLARPDLQSRRALLVERRPLLLLLILLPLPQLPMIRRMEALMEESA